MNARGLDLPVTIPVTLLFLLALRLFVRWLRDRFDVGERLGWVMATLFASLLMPTVVLTLGAVWAAGVEIVRVGNEHLAYRTRGESLRHNFLILFAAGMVAVWVASAIAAMRRHTA